MVDSFKTHTHLPGCIQSLRHLLYSYTYYSNCQKHRRSPNASLPAPPDSISEFSNLIQHTILGMIPAALHGEVAVICSESEPQCIGFN